MTSPPQIRINPAFRRHPEEAEILGRLVVGFGELEFAVCRNAGRAIDMLEIVLRALYRQRVTSSRIDTADALMQAAFDAAGLSQEYKDAMDRVRHCLRIRNQFAHCNWADDSASTGLYFADLQVSAEAPTGFDPSFRHIDVPLLESQEFYFSNTLGWLDFLSDELAVKQGRLASHVWPRPTEQAQPLCYNPPDKHVPPWLTEYQKALHVARALAAQGGPPTPTPAQKALDKARAQKRAKQQAQRAASAKGSLKKNPP